LKSVDEVNCRPPSDLLWPGDRAADCAERDALATRFKALADPTRVAIINCLSAADEVCVCSLTETFDLSQPTISHHLKILRDAGWWNRRDAGPGPTTAWCRKRSPRCAERWRVNVLFVCKQNAGRSQMAQAFYERRGGNARSRGRLRRPHVHRKVAELMPEWRTVFPKRSTLQTPSGRTSS